MVLKASKTLSNEATRASVRCRLHAGSASASLAFVLHRSMHLLSHAQRLELAEDLCGHRRRPALHAHDPRHMRHGSHDYPEEQERPSASLPDLPLEILGQIFAFCLPILDPSEYRFIGPEPAQFIQSARATQLQPFHLAAVCRQWRAASLSWPRAWAHLTFSLDQLDTTKHFGRVSAMVRRVLQRSHAVPMTLQVARRGHDYDRYSFVAQLIADAVPRVTHLIIDVAFITPFDTMCRILKPRMPMLRSAALGGTPRFALGPVLLPVILENTRHLEFLHCESPFQRAITHNCTLSRTTKAAVRFFNLRDVVLTRPDLSDPGPGPATRDDDLSFLAAAAPNLRRLVLIDPEWMETFGERPAQTKDMLAEIGMYTFPNLEYLRLAASDTIMCRPRLSLRFKVPRLQHLVLDSPHDRPLTTLPRLSFISNIACYNSTVKLDRLTQLTMTRWEPLPDAIWYYIIILQDLPALQEVAFPHTRFTRQSLASLCQVFTFDHLIEQGLSNPSLKRIVFLPCTFEAECDPEDILTCVKSRLPVEGVRHYKQPKRYLDEKGDAAQDEDVQPQLLAAFEFCDLSVAPNKADDGRWHFAQEQANAMIRYAWEEAALTETCPD